MLSLSRKAGEAIIINDNITCKVLEVNGKNVKLGFEFPPSSSVYREELYLRIKQENERAQSSVSDVSQALQNLNPAPKKKSEVKR